MEFVELFVDETIPSSNAGKPCMLTMDQTRPWRQTGRRRHAVLQTQFSFFFLVYYFIKAVSSPTQYDGLIRYMILNTISLPRSLVFPVNPVSKDITWRCHISSSRWQFSSSAHNSVWHALAWLRLWRWQREDLNNRDGNPAAAFNYYTHNSQGHNPRHLGSARSNGDSCLAVGLRGPFKRRTAKRNALLWGR